jgi:hypothetical protein
LDEDVIQPAHYDTTIPLGRYASSIEPLSPMSPTEAALGLSTAGCPPRSLSRKSTAGLETSSRKTSSPPVSPPASVSTPPPVPGTQSRKQTRRSVDLGPQNGVSPAQQLSASATQTRPGLTSKKGKHGSEIVPPINVLIVEGMCFEIRRAQF